MLHSIEVQGFSQVGLINSQLDGADFVAFLFHVKPFPE